MHRETMKLSALVLATTLFVAAPRIALAGDLTTKSLWGRHLDAAMANDVDAVMRDFAEDAVVITEDGTFNGKDEIRGFVVKFLDGLTPEAKKSMTVNRETYTDDVVFFHYTIGAWERSAVDFAVVEDGKFATLVVVDFPVEE